LATTIRAVGASHISGAPVRRAGAWVAGRRAPTRLEI